MDILVGKAKLSTSQVIELAGETPESLFDRVYAQMSPEAQATVDQLRATLENNCRNMGEKSSKEAVVMIAMATTGRRELRPVKGGL